jgi:hypothetical protein
VLLVPRRQEEEHQAVTLFDGTALCRSCNETANQNMNEQGQDVEDMLAGVQQRNQEMFRGLGRPGF